MRTLDFAQIQSDEGAHLCTSKSSTADISLIALKFILFDSPWPMLELVPHSLRLAADELPGESRASAAEVGNQSGIDWCILSSWRRPGDTYIKIREASRTALGHITMATLCLTQMFLCLFVCVGSTEYIDIKKRFGMICLVGQGIMCGRYGAICQNVVLNGWMFIFILWSARKRHSGF